MSERRVKVGDESWSRDDDGTWLADRESERFAGDAHRTSQKAALLDEIERYEEIRQRDDAMIKLLQSENAELRAEQEAHAGLTCAEAQELIDSYRVVRYSPPNTSPGST